MFGVRIFCVAMLAVSASALVAVPAGASIPAGNADFCRAVNKIGSSASEANSGASTATLKALAKSINNAASKAPAKVKSAMHKMVSYLKALSGVKSDPVAAAKQLSKGGQQYAKAAVTYSTYIAENCSGVTP